MESSLTSEQLTGQTYNLLGNRKSSRTACFPFVETFVPNDSPRRCPGISERSLRHFPSIFHERTHEHVRMSVCTREDPGVLSWRGRVGERKNEKRTGGGREGWEGGNKSGKNESIGGVFHDAALEAPEGGGRDRRSQADLGPPFCDNGREGGHAYLIG